MVVSKHKCNIVIVVQSLSCVWLFATLWTTACQAPLSWTVSWSLLKFLFTKLVMLSNHLILCHPLLLLPSIFPRIRVFSNESSLCIRWSKYWSFSISLSIEYSGLTSFRIDWFDFLAVKGLSGIFSSQQFASIKHNIQETKRTIQGAPPKTVHQEAHDSQAHQITKYTRPYKLNGE